jgi:hypothetical protein
VAASGKVVQRGIEILDFSEEVRRFALFKDPV